MIELQPAILSKPRKRNKLTRQYLYDGYSLKTKQELIPNNKRKIYKKYNYIIKYKNGLPDLLVDMWENETYKLTSMPNIQSVIAIELLSS